MATQLLENVQPSATWVHGNGQQTSGLWLDSEYGILKEVLLASPQHLSLVPCNDVSNEALESGWNSCAARAASQHGHLVAALDAAGVAVRIVPAVADLPDLSFTRDSSFMTPWGLLGLRPGAVHRRPEVDVVLQVARASHLPIIGRVSAGRVEGGDICLLKPGHVAIGISGQRTDAAGATAVGDLFIRAGWSVMYTPIDPKLLHLDTHFCMLAQGLAIGCVEKLETNFVEAVHRLGIEIVSIHADEVPMLACNMLAIGHGRIVTTDSAPRVNELVRERGMEVITVALDEFTMCGGGVHCLTMPIRRA